MRAGFLALTIFCLFPLGITASHAQIIITPTKIAEYDDPLVELPPPVSGCAIGNRGPAVGYQSFLGSGVTRSLDALIVRPRDCPQCTVGVHVSSVHFLARIDRYCEMFVSWVVMAGVGQGGCTGPPAIGDVLSAGCLNDSEDPFSFNLIIRFPESGTYDVEIPMACPCASALYPLALIIAGYSSHCMDVGEGTVELGYSATLTPCRNWHGITASDDWTPDLGFRGDIIYYAESTCCEPPVSTKSESWGSVKSLFEP